MVAGPGDVRQEVRDVPQPVAVRAVQVGAVAQRVHLVHGDPLQVAAGGGGLDRVEQQAGLAVGERHDEVAVRVDVSEEGLCRFGGEEAAGERRWAIVQWRIQSRERSTARRG